MRLFATRLTAIAATLRRAWSPTSLFAASEPGAWYDPSDMSTMYQDAAGTTPVYMPGQGQVDPPVGLLLDKRLGLTLGPELVSNGEFSGGTAGWSTSSSYQSSAAAVGGEMQVTSTAAFGRQVSPVSLTVGKTYILTGKARAEGGVTARLQVGPISTGGDAGAFVAVLTGSSLQTFGRIVFTATAAQMYVAAGSASAGAVTYFDEISIKELPGNHAYQTTTTCRPTLSARYNLLTATEFPNGISDAPSRAGLVTASALPGYAGALAFGYDGVNTSYAYKAGSPASTTMTLSFVVKMDDGGAPSFGATSSAANSDFALVLRNASIPPATYQVVNLGGGYYRVSGTQASGVGSDGNGIVKYAGNSPRTFKVTAFDLRPANDGVGLPPYQRVVDDNNYGATGFPLYLKFDGVDDFLQTASVDFSGTDKLFASAALRKLSDAAAGIVVELSLVSNSTPGAFALLAPSGATPTMGVYLRGTTTLVTNTLSGIASPASGVLTGVFDLAAITQQARSRINGQPAGGSASSDAGGGVFGSYPLYVGKRGLNASTMFNGRLYGLLIRGADTPDATIATVDLYLNSKARIY